MINNKFVSKARSISFNSKNDKFKRKNIKLPYVWFFTDEKKTKLPMKIIEKLPKNSGVVIRNYSNTKKINVKALKYYRYRRMLKILIAGKFSAPNDFDGIHYPRWLQPYYIKKNYIKSVSVHSGKDVRKCINLKANLVFIAPVFKTTSHKKQNYLGVIKLGLLVKLFKVPVIALGGINETNASRLNNLPISGCAGIDVFIK